MMNSFLWSLQGLLAVVFVLAGGLKLTQPEARVRPLAPSFFSLTFLRGLGALELLGAVGLVLPVLTGIGPWLTPLAAAALGLVLVAAVVVHAHQREYNRLPFLLLLLAAALAVACWRRQGGPTTAAAVVAIRLANHHHPIRSRLPGLPPIQAVTLAKVPACRATSLGQLANSGA